MITLSEIRLWYRGRVSLNVPLGAWSAYQTGGAVDYLFEPADEEDAKALFQTLDRLLPVVLISRRCNLLVSEEGFRGAAVALEHGCGMMTLRPAEGTQRLVDVGGGASVASLVDFCVTHGLGGLEGLAGITGTVAGLVQEGALGARLVSSRTVTVGGESVVLGATLSVETEPVAALLERRRGALRKRNGECPVNLPRAGLVFRDPEGTTAAELLRRAGCAGLRSGGAQVFEGYPNYIVNDGTATASDVMTLLVAMHRNVRDRLGVDLTLRVRAVGFEHTPLRDVA